MSLIQVDLDSDTLARLDAAATTCALSREDALRKAVDCLVAWEQDFRADVAAGIASADRGELHPSGEVEEMFALIRATHTGKVR